MMLLLFAHVNMVKIIETKNFCKVFIQERIIFSLKVESVGQ